ncbi:MAG: hypothetical protein POELPBGB_01098 [Bacteroidia bacterium]|nr:hypothetical protein [Bacteroidia bacterium]
MKKLLFVTILFIAVSVFEARRSISYTSGAPDGFTGSPFDDQTCATYCHHGIPETPLLGVMSSNIPLSGYIPGTTYTISANLVKPGHTKFGFQISPMDDHGNVLGSMIELTGETQITGMGTYITHTQSGTTGIGSKSWSFDWVAPEGGTGDVTFYGAFNVSNNNGSNNGDSIFTSTYTIPEDITVGIELVDRSNEIIVYPNPMKDFFTVSFSETESKISASIFSVNGSVVYNLQTAEGTKTYQLPETISPGIYYLRFSAGSKIYSKKIMVL